MEDENNIRVRRIEAGTEGFPGDAAAVAAIYNEAVRNSTATFDTEPKTILERREWLRSHDDRFSAFIAEDQMWEGNAPKVQPDFIPDSIELAGSVIGWGTISRWSPRRAYDGTGETSIYVRPDARGRRIGTLLLDALVNHAREAGFHVLLARIVTGNVASERAHAGANFQQIGIMKEVGRKFDKWLDVGMWQLMIDEDRRDT